MARKKTKQPKPTETESIFDSVKTLIIEGINLYEKLAPLFTTKEKGDKKNDNNKTHSA